jgi:hypothetical protein
MFTIEVTCRQIFFNALSVKSVFFISRLRGNLKCIPNIDDEIVNYNGATIRIIKYIINNNSYYLATNLIDKNEYTIEVLKQLYGKRWVVEEYFKYIKTNTNMTTNNAKNIDDLMKSVYGYLIVSRVIDILVRIMGRIKTIVS